MSNISKRRKDGSRAKIKTMGDHKEFLKRITKTLYYGELPRLPCLSLPVTEVSCEAWSDAQRGRSLRRLHADAASHIARSACVSPCALVLAVLYLERLKRCNADYLSAAAPADLFLVSLMVSNKFLQDDGEEDEVICSEWAASGGLDLDQLKKLEVEFLNAIEWNVFVSEESFESGLLWLERQVALRQARARGFFTYSDLSIACDPAVFRDAALALAAMVALLASALLLLATCSAPSRLAPRTALRATPLSNATVPSPIPRFIDGPVKTGVLECCDRWSKYQESTESKRNWFDGLVVYDWKTFEPWWSKTSVMNWLYQSSLINPMQRWLEKVNLYTEFFKSEPQRFQRPRWDRCSGGDKFSERRCFRQWLNLSKLSVFVASMSDR